MVMTDFLLSHFGRLLGGVVNILISQENAGKVKQQVALLQSFATRRIAAPKVTYVLLESKPHVFFFSFLKEFYGDLLQ